MSPKVQYARLAGNSLPAGSEDDERVSLCLKYLVSGMMRFVKKIQRVIR